MKTFLLNILLLLLPLLFYSQQENSLLSGLYNSLAEAESDTARMKAYMNLGSYYHLADRDSSSFYYEKALPVAVRLNLKFDEASALNNIGIILMQQEKFSKSLEYYLKAINILKDPKIEKTIWHL